MARAQMLKQLKTDSSGWSSLSLSSELKNVLSSASWALLEAVRLEAEKQKMPLYIAGGFVRDLLIGRPNLDLDLVVEGDAIRLGLTLVNGFGGSLLPHKSFGTAVWSLNADRAEVLRRLHISPKKAELPETIDLISARREIYQHPGALPDVKFADIHQDLYRRDFTINALALRLDGPRAGRLLDPWGGLPDLRRGLLSTLHPQSFKDDPTRILRILRLSSRLDFAIKAKTLRQLKNYLSYLASVSGERIQKELVLTMLEDQRVEILRRMNALGVMKTIDPDLHFKASMARRMKTLSLPSQLWEIEDFAISDLGLVLWLMHLPISKLGAICDRLRLPQALKCPVLSAAHLRPQLKSLIKLPPSQLVARLENEPPLALYACYLAGPESLSETLKSYVSKWRMIRPRATGHILRKKGLNPGPAYSRILARLRDAWLDGEIESDQAESELLEHLLDELR